MKTASSLSDNTSTKAETLQTFLLGFEEKKCDTSEMWKGEQIKARAYA